MSTQLLTIVIAVNQLLVWQMASLSIIHWLQVTCGSSVNFHNLFGALFLHFRHIQDLSQIWKGRSLVPVSSCLDRFKAIVWFLTSCVTSREIWLWAEPTSKLVSLVSLFSKIETQIIPHVTQLDSL